MKFINLHCHKSTDNENFLEIVNQYPKDFDDNSSCFSIGIHPWHIESSRVDEDLQIISEKIKNKNCVALGECGLDKKIEIALDLQIEIFEKQIAIAETNHKPIIVHCVGAFQEIIVIKKRLKINVPMIIHGFSKNEQIAKQLLENGFYLSFGKYLMQSSIVEQVFKNVPIDRFFLETDSSNYGINEVYELASKYKNIEIIEFQRQIHANYSKVFEH